MKKFLFFILLSVCCVARAQVYPVQVSTQLIPPYSLKLSDYVTTHSDKLIANILMTDINEYNRQLRFRITIKGNGLHIRSNDFIIGANPVFIDGGLPLRLTNIDLRPYFELQNLQGITAQQYNNPLPDGNYQFCIEVFDWVSGQRLSNPQLGCSNAYLIVNDPPFLNLPRNGDLIESKNPQNIIFNWTPRHLNATNVQYEFELRELWDTQIDPRAAFLASPNLYQTTTRNNTLLYGPGQTPLLENKTYGWRVRALVSDGISETSVFRNNGYSEIYYFTYAAGCSAPEFILAKSLSSKSEEITWQPNVDYQAYKVQYKKKGVRGAVWFDTNTTNAHARIFNLEPGTTYEFRVGGQCMLPIANQEPRYTFSGVQEFTTPTKEEDSYYNCGIAPEISIKNKNPLPNLTINELFTAGDFPVTVKGIEGQNGIFSGIGYIVVPYLADTKIAVEFNNIRINTDYQLYAGTLYTTYDPTWSNVVDVTDSLKDILSLPQAVQESLKEIKDLLDNWKGTPEQIAALQSQEEELVGQLDKALNAGATSDNLKEKIKDTKESLAKDVDALVAKGTEVTTEDTKQVENTVGNVVENLKAYEKGKKIENDTNGAIVGDDYFDGVITFTNTEQQITIPIDNSPVVHLKDLQDKESTESYVKVNAPVTIRPGKNLIVSASNNIDINSSEDITSVKEQLANVKPDQYLLWLHYDYSKKQVKYKMAFGENYFKGTSLARDDLIELYNDILSFDYKKGIGSAILTATEATEVLLDQYNSLSSVVDKELIAGLDTIDVLKLIIRFAKDCSTNYNAAPNGIVPRCLWQQEGSPIVAYQAGFIDGAWEIIPTAIDTGRFLQAWQPLNSEYYFTNEAGQTRQQTIEVLLLMEQLYQQDALYSTIKQEFTTEFDKYIDETIALDAQARYNQGKLIFEVASLFVGIGEIKGLLNTGKVTSETFQVLRKIPPSMVQFLKSATKFSKDAVLKLENATGKLLLDGQHIITITKQKLTIAKGVLLESIDDNLKPIGELVTPDGYTLSMSDGRSLNEKVLNIVEDAKGKYSVAVAKAGETIVNSLDDFTKLPLKQRLDYLKDAWKAYYPKIFFERKLFEDLMGYYRYVKNAGWGHTNDIAHNFKAIDFYDNFTELGNDIFAETAVSMKTTTTKNVSEWLNTNAISKNIENLINSLGSGAGKGITWNGKTIFYNEAVIHIYMPKENLTNSLREEWLRKLSNEVPQIEFEISALEDFIK